MQTTASSGRLSWVKAALGTAAIAGCCLAAAPGAESPVSTADNVFPGWTTPSEKRAQNFDLPGVVAEMRVKEGDHVKAGQEMARQNTDADKALLEQVKISAASDLEIKAEEATVKKDKVDFDRKVALLPQKAISVGEVDEARLLLEIDTDKLEKAKEDKLIAQSKVAEQEAKIKQKTLVARIDGVVSDISTHEGELTNSDTQHPTVTIVKNDPLYIETEIPAELVRQLKTAAAVKPIQVQYEDEGEKGAWRNATIHFIKPEADPKANTEHVQLEMPNPEGRSSGLRVLVKLPIDMASGNGGSPAAAAAANASH